MQINLSQIKAAGFADANAFENAVAGHIKALRAHQSTNKQAAPVAHALVERSVERVQFPVGAEKPDDFVSAFTIVDDGPTLNERKMVLANSVAATASDLINAIVPPLKLAAWSFDVADAQQVQALDAKNGTKTLTAEQKSTLAQNDARQKKIEAIRRHVAKLHSNIHDLTEDTIGQWQPEPFPA